MTKYQLPIMVSEQVQTLKVKPLKTKSYKIF